MADFVFNLAKGKIAELAERVNVENPANSVFVLVAISTTEEDAILRDLDSLEDVLTNPNTDEATNGGYARLDVEALTVTVDDVENKVAVSMRDQSWSDILAGLAWTDVLICYEPEAGAGDDSQIVPLVCLDFAVVPNGMDITVLFDADGFFESASIIEDQAVVTALATETSSALAASVGGVAADLISSSADGFHVAWNATGEVLSIKDDATAMPLKSGQLGGFYLRDATTFGTPTDGISNGDFATGTTVGWTESLGGDATVLDDSGTKYVQLSNGPIMMWQNWTVQSGKTYIIRGYHRYTAGTASYWWTNFVPIGSTAAGDPFTWWKWEYSDPRSSVGQWTINGNATNTSWEAWSHTVWVPDGCSTMRIELRRFAGTGTSEFKEITVEDLDAAGTRMTHTVTAGTGGDVDFACTGESCTLAATITEETDHLMVTGTIVGDSASEKALFLDFCLPLDQTSMKWAQNYDTEIDHDANAINVYYESHHPTIRSEWQLVTFPVAAVTDATRGVCVANSIEIPRHHKPFRDDNGVFLRHHVGLHANRNTFSFKFAVYKFDEPEWHMRSAMAKYRAIFADQFVEYLTSPNHRHGTQIYTLNGVVADTYDFGIAYNFRGAVDPGFVSNHNDGVAHCPHGMGTELSVSTISDPELSDATQAKDLMDGFETGMDLGINFTWPTTGGTYALDRHDPPGPFSVERTRFDNSKIQTLTGALILFDFTYPLQVLGTNASPQCTSPNAHDLEFDYLTVPQVALHTDESLDFRGHSHDNCAIGAGRTEENYNSGDFAAMTTDLSFNIDTKRVHMKTAYTYWETLKFYADNMHARSPYAISVGNLPSGQPQATQIYSGVLDALGGESETNKAATDKSVWRQQLRDKRALAGGRCLNAISRDVYSPGDADLPRYWSINYLYCCWGNMVGINYQGTAGDFSAADRTECDNWYPTLKILDAAGPDNHIPYVTSDTVDTFVERYGTIGGGDLHFVVYNGTTGSLSPVFTIDQTALGLGTTTWTDIWNDGGGGSQSSITSSITITIPSYRAVVFAVT